MNAQDIDELEDFFNTADIPETMQLSKGVLMHNVPAQITHYIEMLRNHKPGLYTTEPRYHDLVRIREILTEKAG